MVGHYVTGGTEMSKLLKKGIRIIDLVFSFLIMKLLAPLLNISGYYVFRKHFYLPIPDKRDLVYQKDSQLVGLSINDKQCFEFLENVISKYKKEFNAFPIHGDKNAHDYYLLNGGFMAIDGNVYYSLIRHLKPAKIIEIGSGWSSLLAMKAIKKNREESGKNTNLTLIEPFPSNYLTKGTDATTELIPKKVQEIGLDFFGSLGPGDILFIDSTHSLKSGGDVWYEYCEILPLLQAGVYVHVHDISLPKPYPHVYYDNQLFWNEQYLLQAFLTYNTKFDIVWPGNYMLIKYSEKIRAAFLPELDLMRQKYPFSEATSFWMQVK